MGSSGDNDIWDQLIPQIYHCTCFLAYLSFLIHISVGGELVAIPICIVAIHNK